MRVISEKQVKAAAPGENSWSLSSAGLIVCVVRFGVKFSALMDVYLPLEEAVK